jgi:23S rRNA pseudouridine2605 synthase
VNHEEKPDGVRLQKVLAQAGVASRRAAEDMIAAGRVSVDGKIVREMGRRVDPESAVVHVDGNRVVVRDDVVHLALNKPFGMLSTMSDDQGRPCVGDLIAERAELINRAGRLFHVGRLDADTEGLLLLTNDGELGHRLMHPSYEIEKTYLAEVMGQVPRDLGRRLRKTYLAKVHGNVARDVGKRLREGVELDDGLATVDSFKLVDNLPGHSMVEVVLHEGRKHIVRRLLDFVGYPVEQLVRTAIGEVRLGNQRPGKVRPLTVTEVGQLYRAVGL